MGPHRKGVRPGSQREHYGSIEARSRWLSDVLRRRIWSYIPGSRLPGERELARQFRISLRVARRATEILTEEGLVSSHRGKGSIVVREQVGATPVRRVIAVISGEKQSSATETQATLLGAHEDCGRRGRAFEVIHSDRLDLNQPDCLMSLVRGGGLPLEVGWMFVRISPPVHVLETWQIWRLPLVLVNSDPRLATNTVNSDGQGAIYRAVERAWLLGHRRIAYVSGPRVDADPIAATRWHGFQLAHQRYQGNQPIDAQMVWHVESADSAAQEAQRFLLDRLAGSPRPTAVIAADQRLGCDVLAAATRLNIAVPGQFSVISAGMERRDLPRDLAHRLSRSSEGRPEKIGQLATSLLMNAHLSTSPVKLVAECEWIDGGSLGPLAETPTSGPDRQK